MTYEFVLAQALNNGKRFGPWIDQFKGGNYIGKHGILVWAIFSRMLLKKNWVLVFSFMYLVLVDAMDWSEIKKRIVSAETTRGNTVP